VIDTGEVSVKEALEKIVSLLKEKSANK